MKVVSVSVPKTIYNPGDTIPLSVTVQWGLADTGGVVSVLYRGEGESYWHTIGTFDVGAPGIGLPNVLKAGKNQTTISSISAPDTTGYYQIGAKEQSESQVSANGSVQIQVVPETPSAETGSGVVHVTLNQEAPADLILYVNNTPMMRLPTGGIYVNLVAGVYMLSAEGTGFKTPFSVQVVVTPGTSQEITLPLVAKTGTEGIDWTFIAVAVGAAAGLGLLAVTMLREK